MANPLSRAKDAVNELLQMNDRTRGKVVKRSFLGKDVFVMMLGERGRIIEGDWSDGDTVDICDLMDAWQRDND